MTIPVDITLRDRGYVSGDLLQGVNREVVPVVKRLRRAVNEASTWLPVAAVAAGITTQMWSSGTLSLANSNGVSWGLSNNVLTASVAAAAGGGVAVSAAGSSVSAGTVVWSNSNGLAFGMNGSTITGSYTQATVQAAIAAVGGTITSGTASFVNANGVSFSVNGQTVSGSVAAGATATGNLGGIGADTQTATSGTVVFSNSNNVTFGMSGSSRITASIPAGATATGNLGGLGAGTQTATSGTVVFSDSNNVTFGMSGSTRVTASIPAGATATGNIGALSAGTQSGSSGTFLFSDSNNVTFGMSGSTRITASIPAGATATGNLGAIAAGTQTATSGTVVWSDSNGMTFGMSGSTRVTGSYSAPRVVSVSGGNSIASGTLVFASTAGNITWGMSTDANGGTVTASAPSGGGGGAFAAGVSTFGNTAGTTGLVSSQLVLVGTGGVTLSQSTNGQSATVSISVAADPLVSQYPEMPFPWATSTMYTGASTTTAGGSVSTLSWYIAPLLLENNITFNAAEMVASVAATVAGTGSGTHRHVLGIYTRNASTLSLITSFAWNAVHSQNSVTAQTLSWWAGAYSGNTAASTSRISGNVSASITGLHLLNANATSSATSLSAGHYFLAHGYNMRSSSSALFAMGTVWRYSVSQFTGALGFSSTTGPMLGEPWNGIASTTTTTPTQFEFVAPGSIHSTAITATGGTTLNQWPLVQLQSRTA